MKSMQLKKLAVISALLALAGTAFVPAVLAHPINANLTWLPDPITSGSTTTATFGVNDVTPGPSPVSDPDCPSGDTFTGTLTVVTPAPSSSSSTFTVSTPTPCGTTGLTATYPTNFVGNPSTVECGVYSATWAGVSSALIGNIHPTFNVTDNFVVTCPNGAPQFAAPAVLVAAMGLVLVAAAKKGRLLKL
jgi:hypothetical protein